MAARFFSIFLLLALCGCSSFPKQMTGRFDAGEPKQDCIVFKKDGALFWSGPRKAAARLQFVGIGLVDKKDPLLVWLTVPSSSPFLNSSVRFSPDYSRATVDWGRSPRIGDAIQYHSTEFKRADAK